MMTTPVTIREHAQASLKYFTQESDAIIQKAASDRKTSIRLANVCRIAALIFGSIGIANAMYAVYARSYLPLRYTAIGWFGVLAILGIGVKYLNPFYEQAIKIETSITPLSQAIKTLSASWKSDKIVELTEEQVRITNTIGVFLSNYELIHEKTARKYPWTICLKDQNKTIKSLTTIFVIQLTFDLLRLPPEMKEPNMVESFLRKTNLPDEFLLKIGNIIELIRCEPNLKYQGELTLSIMDNFDPEKLKEV